MNRSESKFKNTASKMNRALFNLLERKQFSEISTMDVCAEAGVNRSTFYAHYDNTYDLLQEAFQGVVSNFFAESFDTPPDMGRLQSLGKDDLNFITPKYLVPYLEYIKKHRRLFKIYAENAHVFDVNRLDDYIIDNLFVPILEKYGVTDKKLVHYMQKYFLKGIDAIVNEWVRHDCEDDVLFVCEIIIFCVRPVSR